jgi:predicted Fe-Mo cluster-binding NifX family protein
MRIAIPYRMERVSPVFDVAKHLLLVDIENSSEVARDTKTIDDADLMDRVRYVEDLDVDLLICGAISRPLAQILEAKGIEVIGQICGNTEEILQAFLQGGLNDQSFLMPGCRMHRRQFHRTSRANGNGQRRMYMHIAITSQGPDLTSQVDPRFGRARYLIVIDTETEESTALDNSRNLNAAQGAGIQTAKNVVNEGVDAVLTGQVGPKAREVLEAAQVDVFLGASGTVEDALGELKSGQLRPLSSTEVA